MPISHRRHGQDKTVLSCPCRRCELKWRQVKTVLSCLEMLCELTVFLSRPSLEFATVQCQIYWGLLKTVLSCRQFSSHCWHGSDKTVLSCPCRRCELGNNLFEHFHTVISIDRHDQSLCMELAGIISSCQSDATSLLFSSLTHVSSATALYSAIAPPPNVPRRWFKLTFRNRCELSSVFLTSEIATALSINGILWLNAKFLVARLICCPQNCAP